ncbi:MAG: Rpn family recombination-promoting nuclease/putative transposase, partial [Parabacteroides sp.]|nr:Rpn family recombination-promoting nuclease/putative transposase [Parabacteroides sp.]
MGKFINPFTDFSFHRIFGQEVHKELLIDFLNQLLIGERQIVDITFQNPILQPKTIDDRGVIFDIHCRDDQGGWFVVEMEPNPTFTTGVSITYRGLLVIKGK